MTMRDDRFAAYVRRHELCRGGRITPKWSTNGGALFFGEGKDRMRVDCTSGVATSDPAPPATATTPATPEMWMRGGYVGEMPAFEMPSPDGAWLAAIREGEIVVRSTRDDHRRTLTSGATDDLSWDIEAGRGRLLPGLLAEMVAISPWRPDGGALFACRRDITGVFRIPTIHWLGDLERVDFTPFEKAGAPIDRYHPYIVPLEGDPLPIAIGPVEDRYVQLLGWRPDGSEVLLIVYDRDMRRAQIVAADAATGATRTLLNETADTFLRIQHDSLLSGIHGFALLPDGGFLWLSARDGWSHIYRYAADGRPVAQLTNGAWPVHDIVQVGTDDFIYFTAAHDAARPYDIHVCRVPLDGGAVARLTDLPGIHRPQFAPGGGVFVDIHSAADRPWASDLRRADGQYVARLETMDIAPLAAVGYTAPEEFTILAADGETELWGVLYKPADFDPARRYPVIEHIYGGPQIAATARHFAVDIRPSRNLAWALAQRGYIVVALDARGTPGRSKAFQDVVYGAWGVNELADHAGAIRQLAARHAWIDASRVGIIGHSWGGYFSTLALIQAPDLYSVAISSSPGYRPWESILYEPYLGLPAANAAAYDRADVTQHAAGVRGNLLLVAGTTEYGPISDAMKMSRALIDAGIQHEFAVLPGEVHSYSGATEDYFIAKAVAFLDRHLPPEGSAR